MKTAVRFPAFIAVVSLFGLLAAGLAPAAPPPVTIVKDFINNGSGPVGPLVRDTDGNFYGATSYGGAQNLGTIFKVAPDGTLSTLHDFNGFDGAVPQAGLILSRDGYFYGTTSQGGSDYLPYTNPDGYAPGRGTVFSIGIGGDFYSLVSFGALPVGAPAVPKGELLEAADGNFYGSSVVGGSADLGTIFQVTNYGAVNVLVSFDGTNGAKPAAALIQTPDNFFYGSTQGDIGHNGTVFRLDEAGTITPLATFPPQNNVGTGPGAPLLLASDGSFYGTTYRGGAGVSGEGTIFKVTPTGDFTVVHSFGGGQLNANDGAEPQGALALGPDGALYGTTRTGFGSVGTIYRLTLDGQFSLVYQFAYTTGLFSLSGPAGGLLLGPDGNFYGTTNGLGSNGLGSVFQLPPTGVPTFLASFYYPLGASPTALTLGPDGNLYGVTRYGGPFNAGVAFRLDATGNAVTLANFDPATTTGIHPDEPLTLGADGAFYGVTPYNGAGFLYAGSLYRLSLDGTLSTVAMPPALPRNNGPLVLGSNGFLYGLSSGDGKFFRVNSDGSIATLYVFPQSNLQHGYDALTLGPSGDFYGYTPNGGANGKGTIYKLTPAGAFSNVADFNGDNGSTPVGALALGHDGNFYGLTYSSSSPTLDGTLFRLSPATGALTTLAHGFFIQASSYGPALTVSSDGGVYGHEYYTGLFRLGADGALNPVAIAPLSFESEGGPVRDFMFTAGQSGSVYGTTLAGGNSGAGSIFKYDPSGAPTPTPTPTRTPTPTPTPTPPVTPTPTPTPPPGSTPTPTPTPSPLPTPTPTPTPRPLVLYGINRNSGGQGPVLVTIFGSGFQPGASVRLSATGQPDVVSSSATVSSGGFSLDAILPLAGRAAGINTVSVVNPSGMTSSLPGAFTVAPTSLNLSAAQGGDTGAATIIFSGNINFLPGASVRFVAAGRPDIVGSAVVIAVDGLGLTATFDLRGKTNGFYDVVATNPDGNVLTVAGAFEIVPGRAPEMYADIVGRTSLRGGRAQTYTVIVGNRGNVDAGCVPLYIRFSKYLQPTILTPLLTPPQPPGITVPIDFDKIPLFYTGGDLTDLPLLVARVPAGGVKVFTMTLTAPDRLEFAHVPFTISVVVGEPQLDAASGLPAAGGRPARADRLTAPQVTLNCFTSFLSILIDCGSIFFPPLQAALAAEKCASLAIAIQQAFLNAVSVNSSPAVGFISNAQVGASLLSGLGQCLGRLDPATAEIISLFQCAWDFPVFIENCYKPALELRGSTVVSNDPNDLVGDMGDGSDGHFVAGQTPLRYTVFFANQENASAPAQRVVLTAQLDPAAVDLTTFKLGAIGFGATSVMPPDGVQSYSTFVDLRPANNLLVKIDAALNPATGLLTYTLDSIDPATGQAPDDPLAGFLPADKTPPEGEGFAAFSVQPKAGLTTGTVISQSASIVFDTNAAIPTAAWINTVDNEPPTSTLKALPKTRDKAAIKLKLKGDDAGSGVKNYTIYVSEDGGSFEPLVRNAAGPKTVFNGVTGHRYAFISQARDAADNLEPLRTKAQTKIKIVGPDLTGSWGDDVRAKPKPTGRTKLKGSFTLRNQSPDQSTTAPGTVRFYVSPLAKLDDSATPLGQEAAFDVLPGGGTVTFNLVGAKLAEGQSSTGLFLFAVIDPAGAVSETDKGNNQIISGPLP